MCCIEYCLTSKCVTFIGSMDYVPVSQVLTFDGERRKCLSIPIIDDNSLEMNEESFKVTLTRTEGLDEGIQLTTDEGQVTIRENDGMYYVLYSSDAIAIFVFSSPEFAIVGLERMVYTVAEDDNVVEVCAVVFFPSGGCPIEFDFKIRLETGDGSAGKCNILYSQVNLH